MVACLKAEGTEPEGREKLINVMETRDNCRGDGRKDWKEKAVEQKERKREIRDGTVARRRKRSSKCRLDSLNFVVEKIVKVLCRDRGCRAWKGRPKKAVASREEALWVPLSCCK